MQASLNENFIGCIFQESLSTDLCEVYRKNDGVDYHLISFCYDRGMYVKIKTIANESGTVRHKPTQYPDYSPQAELLSKEEYLLNSFKCYSDEFLNPQGVSCRI